MAKSLKNVKTYLTIIVKQHTAVNGSSIRTGAFGNRKIGDGELWAGVPAKFVKKVDAEQAQALNKTYARHYIEYSDWYREADSNPENTQNVTTSDEYVYRG